MRVKNKKKEEDLRIAFFSIVLRVKTGKNREEIREMRNKKRGNPRFRGSLSCLKIMDFRRVSGQNMLSLSHFYKCAKFQLIIKKCRKSANMQP